MRDEITRATVLVATGNECRQRIIEEYFSTDVLDWEIVAAPNLASVTEQAKHLQLDAIVIDQGFVDEISPACLRRHMPHGPILVLCYELSFYDAHLQLECINGSLTSLSGIPDRLRSRIAQRDVPPFRRNTAIVAISQNGLRVKVFNSLQAQGYRLLACMGWPTVMKYCLSDDTSVDLAIVSIAPAQEEERRATDDLSRSGIPQVLILSDLASRERPLSLSAPVHVLHPDQALRALELHQPAHTVNTTAG